MKALAFIITMKISTLRLYVLAMVSHTNTNDYIDLYNAMKTSMLRLYVLAMVSHTNTNDYIDLYNAMETSMLRLYMFQLWSAMPTLMIT